MMNCPLSGVGLGFRRDIADLLLNWGDENKPRFVELAPENWMSLGGASKVLLEKVAAQYPITTHGLSLSIGSPDEIDFGFLAQVKDFLDRFQIEHYTEHLSFSQCNNVHLYDLLPVAFTNNAVEHVAAKVARVQDFMKRELILENISYYTNVPSEMSELEFITKIAEKCGCGLLLDVNNVYVNAFNHSYDPYAFLNSFPLDKVKYIHMAGHTKVSEDLIIDTHGEEIIQPVYDLLKFVLPKLSRVPILLERDFNFPENPEDLKRELRQLNRIENEVIKQSYHA
ncbi:DUF692 domain-containing protein [Wandonia haliotis]|uniref:DUF692 domain-containing protein n=1 Tax=Wandonia haliotis TaxID=574963 RepID=A0ABN1MML4_9FLAO